MKKRIFAAVAALTVIFALSGCVMPKFTTERYVYGKGKVTEVSYEVGGFESISLYCEAVLVYKKGEFAPVKIEAQKNLHEYFTVKVVEGMLRIIEEGNVKTDTLPIITITAPEIKEMSIIANSVSEESDVLKAERVDLHIAGNGTAVNVNVDVGELMVNSLLRDITVKGYADRAYFVVGDTNINGLELHAREAKISMDGEGSGSISCSDKLDISIMGSGNFRYKGDPVVTQIITGSGTLERIAD